MSSYKTHRCPSKNGGVSSVDVLIFGSTDIEIGSSFDSSPSFESFSGGGGESGGGGASGGWE